MIKDADIQSDEETHRTKTGWVSSAVTSVPVELKCVILPVWMCSLIWKLSNAPICILFHGAQLICFCFPLSLSYMSWDAVSITCLATNTLSPPQVSVPLMYPWMASSLSVNVTQFLCALLSLHSPCHTHRAVSSFLPSCRLSCWNQPCVFSDSCMFSPREPCYVIFILLSLQETALIKGCF